ncbi:MAG: hypothetical protein A2026_01375 [Deltaproteobacteria bacterium RBG_19FT_COMBO_46_12]|nr:MAG: hypothetical protein A2026_01375 [Deltaproteobacteria bacterium RBG_19FT_COMBO_46_12]
MKGVEENYMALQFLYFKSATYFSFRTPLKGLGSAFWSINLPVSLSRLTHRRGRDYCFQLTK